jgi:putative ABC transport system ATP-binding protein
MAPIVEIRGLTKVYRRGNVEVTPLQETDLTVAEGEFLCLMGPSGSGKTTLLNIVAGVDEPTAGEVTVAGERLDRLPDDRLSRWRTRNIGYIFQSFNLVPVLTAQENVELPLMLLPLDRERRRRQAETALKAAGIEHRGEHFPRQLSGGQEQRVAIARAIAADPRIIVADEPTGDLDAASEKEIMELLATLHRDFGKTIIMVTHDPEAASYAGRTLHLSKGVLEEQAAAAAGPKKEGE